MAANKTVAILQTIFKLVLLNEKKWCSLIKISLKFAHSGPIYNDPALDQIMAWRRTGDKPSSEQLASISKRINAKRIKQNSYVFIQ